MTTTSSSNTTQKNEFALQRIYAQVSSEVPLAPSVFEITDTPQLDIKLNVNHEAIQSNLGNYNIELSVCVTAVQKDKTLFLIEVKQGGIFSVNGFDQATLEKILNIHCPALLYPYASALVSDLVLRAGFMPLHLPPVDFNAMYEQQKESQGV